MPHSVRIATESGCTDLRRGGALGGKLLDAASRKFAPPHTFREIELMGTTQSVIVGRRSVRGIVIDDQGQLLLIKRTRPGQAPYWTSPGGGLEESDATVEDALQRELAEELGATVEVRRQVFLASDPSDSGVAIQYFFVARLTSLNLSERYGSEFSDAARGRYDLEQVSLQDESLRRIDLKPAALKEFVLANQDAILAEAGFGS
jgi:ADP-ribose pyrophosphatase YjhB (NUDIX family)